MFFLPLSYLGGFLVVCFLHKINPNPRKNYLAVRGKSGPECPFFQAYISWVGLALGWGVRRFRNNIYIFSNPTEIGIIANTPVKQEKQHGHGTQHGYETEQGRET